jgi:hypothetical protein
MSFCEAYCFKVCDKCGSCASSSQLHTEIMFVDGDTSCAQS